MNRHTPNLDRTAFDTRDAVQGEDGEWYHLPTLRALHRLGRLHMDSPAYMILMSVLHSEMPPSARLTA